MPSLLLLKPSLPTIARLSLPGCPRQILHFFLLSPWLVHANDHSYPLPSPWQSSLEQHWGCLRPMDRAAVFSLRDLEYADETIQVDMIAGSMVISSMAHCLLQPPGRLTPCKGMRSVTVTMLFPVESWCGWSSEVGVPCPTLPLRGKPSGPSGLGCTSCCSR